MKRRLFLAQLGLGLLLSCTHPVSGRSPEGLRASGGADKETQFTPSSATAQATTTAQLPDPESSSPALATFDYATLRKLEAAGFGFGAMALGTEPTLVPMDNQALSLDPGYASIVSVLAKDLDEFIAADKHAGVGMKFAHRAFDKRWLTSPKFHFELVAVVHRVDRRVFEPATCGELRLVYRLAYESQVDGQPVASRVPMTVNVVRWINDPGCQRWLAAMRLVEANHQTEASTWWTAPGAPLSAAMLALTSPKSVEVNLQSVRWPSTVRPNMAGHAEYLLRVFHRAAASGPFSVAVLENTPDVKRLSQDQATRRRLSDWLRAPEQAVAIAQGTVRVPDEFLATRATSVAPHGLARKTNRPFAALLSDDWADRSDATSVLRRLDGLSCPGCHQSRSVAGFHILGNEGTYKRADKLALPHSPHFTDEMVRRREYVSAVISGGAPDEFRAPAEHPLGAGGWGSRCGLDVSPSAPFATWMCEQGLTCRAIDDALVGECMPPVAAIGDACESGTTTWDSSVRELTRLAPPTSCGDGRVCERNAVGFPGGMCSSGCGNSNHLEGICAGIAVLDSFNACIARGEVFETCLATTTRPGTLRRCSHEAPCRDDYVCAATSSGGGACLPPYFLFQLRVDGHAIQ